MAVTLHWAFDQKQGTDSVPNEGAGGTYPVDTSTALLGAASFYTGSAMRTRGTNAVDTPDLFAFYASAGIAPAGIYPGSSHTLELWARIGVYDTNKQVLFTPSVDSPDPYFWWDILGFRISTFRWTPGIDVVDTWVHFAVTWNGTIGKLFINGYEVDSGAGAGPDLTAGLYFGFGYYFDFTHTYNWYGNADIADFKIHDEALNAAQLQAIVAAFAPATPRNRNRLLSNAERREQWALAELSMPDRCTIIRYEGDTWATVRADVPCRVIPQPVRSGVDATGDTVTFETAQIVVSARYALPTFPFKVARFLVNGILWESLNLLIGADDVTRSIECKRVN